MDQDKDLLIKNLLFLINKEIKYKNSLLIKGGTKDYTMAIDDSISYSNGKIKGLREAIKIIEEM